MAQDRDVPPDAPMPAIGGDPTSALAVWLAGPAARPLFTPEAQSAADVTRWRDIVSPRRRDEWEVSRALLAHVRGEFGERGPAAAGDVSGIAGAVAGETASASLGEVPALAAAGSEAFPSAATPVQTVRAPSAAPVAPDGVALSLSHSGGYAAAAASRSAIRVGVDLECERPRDMERVARFAFAERECAQLDALATAGARVERFYILWTLKEAFAKALSLPLLASLRQCTFFEESGAWRGSVPTESAWVARTFRASPRLVLSVVALLPKHVSAGNFSVSTHEWPAPAVAAWHTLAALRSDA
jgi:4'-phosphopantetheinyl transferase